MEMSVGGLGDSGELFVPARYVSSNCSSTGVDTRTACDILSDGPKIAEISWSVSKEESFVSLNVLKAKRSTANDGVP